MGRFLRNLGGVIAGLVVGVLVIAVVEFASSKVYPLPAGIDPSDMKAFRLYMAQLLLGAFLFVLAAWGAGTFLGSWTATRIVAPRGPAGGAIVGAVLLAAGVANMLMLPHPGWFWVAAIVVLVSCTFLGTRMAA
jgi:hypothetical protein